MHWNFANIDSHRFRAYHRNRSFLAHSRLLIRTLAHTLIITELYPGTQHLQYKRTRLYIYYSAWAPSIIFHWEDRQPRHPGPFLFGKMHEYGKTKFLPKNSFGLLAGARMSSLPGARVHVTNRKSHAATKSNNDVGYHVAANCFSRNVPAAAVEKAKMAPPHSRIGTYR